VCLAEGFPGTKRYTAPSCKFGAAFNAGKFSDTGGVRSSGNDLVYGAVYRGSYRGRPGSSRTVDAFIGFDWSPGDTSCKNATIIGGGRYNGPFASRPQNTMDVGGSLRHDDVPVSGSGPEWASDLTGGER
jgi:hypothetical protein